MFSSNDLNQNMFKNALLFYCKYHQLLLVFGGWVLYSHRLRDFIHA